MFLVIHAYKHEYDMIFIHKSQATPYTYNRVNLINMRVTLEISKKLFAVEYQELQCSHLIPNVYTVAYFVSSFLPAVRTKFIQISSS